MVLRIEKSDALMELLRNRSQLGLKEDSCVMCALSSSTKQPPILETEHAVVTLDRFAASPGHLLVIAREHVESLTELDHGVYAHLQELCFRAAKIVERRFSATRVFVAALGASENVPMSFPHFHIHVIPIQERGEMARPARVFSWSAGVVVYSEEEAALLTKELRSDFESSLPLLARCLS